MRRLTEIPWNWHHFAFALENCGIPMSDEIVISAATYTKTFWVAKRTLPNDLAQLRICYARSWKSECRTRSGFQRALIWRCMSWLEGHWEALPAWVSGFMAAPRRISRSMYESSAHCPGTHLLAVAKPVTNSFLIRWLSLQRESWCLVVVYEARHSDYYS